MEKKYSVADIDQMRSLTERLVEGCWYWQYDGRSFYSSSACYFQAERTAEVEGRLRTYMLAGTTVEELQAAVGELQKAEDAQRDRAVASWNASQIMGLKR